MQGFSRSSVHLGLAVLFAACATKNNPVEEASEGWIRSSEQGGTFFLVQGDTIYMGMSTGVQRSLDGGKNWSPLLIVGKPVWAGTSSKGRLYFGSHAGENDLESWVSALVYVSSNRGLTWDSVRVGGWLEGVTAVHATDSVLLVGTGQGIYRSTNNGVAFTGALSGLTITRILLKGEKYFVTTTGEGLFGSVDYGRTWINFSENLPTRVLYAMIGTPDRIYVGSDRGLIFVSENDGVNWSSVNTGLVNSFINDLSVSAGRLLAGTGAGILVSTNGGLQWADATGNLPHRMIYVIGVTSSHLFVTINQGVWRISLSALR